MDRWEHTCVTHDPNGPSVKFTLDPMSRDGWELVAVTPNPDIYTVGKVDLWFKRREVDAK